MADDNPLGYGGDTGIGGSDSGFFDWSSNPQGPGQSDKPQEESYQSENLNTAKDVYDIRKKLYKEKYDKWDSMETALNEMRDRYMATLQEDKNIKPPTPMGHPAPPDMTPEEAQELQKAGMGAIATTLPMTTIGGLRNRSTGLGAVMGGIGGVINSIRAIKGKRPLGGGLTAHQQFMENYTRWKEIDKYVSDYNADQVKSYNEQLSNRRLEKSDQIEAIKTLAAIYKDPVVESSAKMGDLEKIAKDIDNIQNMEERRKRGVTNLDREAYKTMSSLPEFKKYAGMILQKSGGKINLLDESHFIDKFAHVAEGKDPKYPAFQQFEGESSPDKETGKSKHPEMAPDSQKPKVTADDLNNILEH